MLTPDQIQALGDQAAQMTVAMEEYLIRDIARRVREAGQLTSTAAYQIWQAQRLGLSRRRIEQMLRRELKVSHKRLRELLTQSAKVGYDFDVSRLPRRAVPFEENTVLQQIIAAAVELAKKDFTNLTQTMGLVAPDGKAYPLRKAYQKIVDFAFQQVITGTTDHQTALRQATQRLADYGLRSIDYRSGVHTSLEAAVRRSIMGGLGLMQERISQQNHDLLEADGWEISAHAASAPDHEPIQGRQYSDEVYRQLNDSLARRIGTLNCGHAAFPILLGVSVPLYTEAELARLREENARGIRYEGKQYTLYQATQKQRELERAIRRQKRRIMAAEETGDREGLAAARTRHTLLRQRYREFSKAAGLRVQEERVWVAEGDIPAQEGKPLAISPKNVTIPLEETKGVSDVRKVCDLDIETYRCVTPDIRTSEVIITDERIAHIRERHPNDYERYAQYLTEMIQRPQYILEDQVPATAVILQEFSEAGEHFRLVLKLAIVEDGTAKKNSIITFLKISEKKFKKYLRNKIVLYKRE